MKKKNTSKSGAEASVNSPGASNTPARQTTGQRFFGEPPVSVDGNVAMDGTLVGPFVNADDSQYYNSPYYKLNKNNVLAFRSTTGTGIMDLTSVLPAQAITDIETSKQISFHSVGDTGATVLSKFDNTESVADMMAEDLNASNGPAFFFHLGDVVYNFGEEQYYYEQFYEAYRMYNAPIFAIPGNHDGMVYNATMISLQAFEDNFCTNGPQKAPDAATLARTTMDQPGVYFTLDAPFVSIIGLYSNVLDGTPGGIISTMNGKFPTINPDQLTFLNKELARIKQLRITGKRAIILAVHHPLFSGDSKNGGSPLMAQDLTAAFNNAGIWPDAIFSGHAHNYQRFSWTVNGKQIPCIIAGSGGFNATTIKSAPTSYPFPIPGRNDLVMENYFATYGYLEVTVNTNDNTLTINFNTPETKTAARKTGADSVVVNL